MFGDKDHNATLEKLTPLQLPVNTLHHNHELYKVRKSFYYVFVISWLYEYKAHLRLASEYFDVELFEMELLNLLNPPPLDESVLFINKLKIQLMNLLTNLSSKFQAQDFDAIIKRFFIDTPLGDPDTATKFDNLKLIEKFETLFIILNHLSTLAGFRAFLEKNPEVPSTLFNNILLSTSSKGTQEDHLLLFNNTKVYKRTIEYPELVVPKKRKDSPEDPDDYFWDKFDIDLSLVTFELEAWSIADFEALIKSTKKVLGFKKLSTKDFQANVLASEIRKRKIIQNRRKEYQMINLMATRKKSSRIEAKERQRQQEIEDLEAQRENELRLAIELEKITKPINYNSTTLSREQRLKMRKLNTDYRKTPDKDVSQEPEKSEVDPLSKVEPESELSNQEQGETVPQDQNLT